MNQTIKATYFARSEKGQALITLLFFVVIAIIVTSAGIIILATNSLSAGKLQDSTAIYYDAESGAENALLQLLRNPGYTGETIQVDTASVIIQVTQGNPITILSTAQDGNFVRKVEIQATYTNNILTVSSWKEVY